MGSTSDINAVDTHFHLWDLQRWKYEWPTEAEKGIFRNFALSDYNSDRTNTKVKYAVYVEAHDSVVETRWAIENFHAADCPVKGIVGFAHLGNADKLDAELAEFTKEPKFVGVRNVLPLQPDGWLGSPEVMLGMEVLQKYGVAYDLLIKKENFKDALEVVKRNPGVKYVVDHLAKPNAKSGETKEWFDGMSALASHPNVHCKLSGLVTEADLENWKSDDFTKHVDHVVQAFGVDRVMFGSDWPVCKMAGADLVDVYDLLDGLLTDVTVEDKKKIFESNAVGFYNLKI